MRATEPETIVALGRLRHLDQVSPSENLLRKRHHVAGVQQSASYKDLVREFATETFDFGPTLFVLRKGLYARWCAWAEGIIDPSTPVAFGRARREAVPVLPGDRVRTQGMQKRYYRGLTLRHGAARANKLAPITPTSPCPAGH
jgi:hypothetical protein